jgi:cellulose synthase/poly-beta-1,6-N-acetylglucosamine synthase-like glycosyltransferase
VSKRHPIRRRIARASTATAGGAAVLAAFETAHLLGLLGAARRARRQTAPRASFELSWAIVIPAHDEEQDVARAIRSVQALDYPSDRIRIVVVADNCSDGTADVARRAGAEVWERTDAANRGKGYALSWAFSRLVRDRGLDAVCVLDADCEASANLLAALGARLQRGAGAVQAAFLVANPDASPVAALRWAGFALFNVIRPLGRDRLGLSSGLLGTGMAASRELLERSPWQSFTYAEDREQHMRWVLAGARVAFAAEAQVVSPAPVATTDTRAQETRWESGRLALARDLTPVLLARWLRTGEPACLDAALEPLLLPQALLLTTSVATLGASCVLRYRAGTRIAVAALAGQSLYVIAGLQAVGAPRSVWLALARTPQFVARRVSRVGGSLGRAPAGWERTPRGTAAGPTA